MNDASDRSIMTALREDTRALHDAAENEGFPQALMRGELPRETYADSLEQLLLIHQALEARLAAANGPAFQRVVREEQFQAANLRRDLAYFGRSADGLVPLGSTAQLIASIERTAREKPLGLLGYHYVLEGSKNGARILAGRVRAAYGLPEGEGTAYLDPHGEQQRALWMQFRGAMDTVPFTVEERVVVVEAAGEMFRSIAALYREIYEAMSATAH